MSSEENKMVLRENYCYVTYSDDTAKYYNFGLMPYNRNDNGDIKSFVISVNQVDPENPKMLSKKIKEHFGAIGDDETPSKESLGGKGNVRLKDSEDEYFFGYIFWPKNGQKVLEWFAERSAKLPDREDVEVPEKIRSKKEIEKYTRQWSKHSLEELAKLLDVKIKDKKSKASSPKIIKGANIDAPLKSSPVKPTLPSRTGQIPGIPTSRKARETTDKDIQDAINLIFKAIIDGKIKPDSIYQYYWEDPTGETTERDEDEKNIPEVYNGFVGTRESTRPLVKDVLNTKPTGQYDTSEIEPTLIFRLMSYRKVPKE